MNKERAKQFILDNARPLELALYRYFFENSSQECVLSELKKYQNHDGGFGHGLEADNWNPLSNPIATNDAIITLYRIDALGVDNTEMVQRITEYLSSHESFDEEKKRWLFAIDSNRDYPHATWWEKDGDGISHFNPTVSLAAFMVCFGDAKDKEYYAQIVREAFAAISELKQFGDELKCYLLAHSLFTKYKIDDVINLGNSKKDITSKLQEIICSDITKYGVEYVPTPSDFFVGIYKEYITDAIKPLIEAEKNVLGNLQKNDGGFDISWKWYTQYEEFETARNWWRPRLTIDKLLFADYA
ncbi:hypothetical protein [Butyrivibrio sp. INlla16]|uniref:hypothetical protein n=1 Tax=Butyrivibrio sp. INlla16 TaxID=1520807 RepID=UPI00089116A8|nr:hypothetical protein [Butyrivibrio sp. INlla16]SDB69666.1 hypothetical protein SAMN02910263_04492 [Butyrivibrio sp. INlla16]